MRNLKRVLSLAMASVMLLGMMVIGAGAVDYKDSNDVSFDEAVAVMSAIGVFQGDNNGNFMPKGDLTREAAAKIITYMLMGKDAADGLATSKAPFTDVAATRWSAGSIAYCVANGIVAGDGQGNFFPEAVVTGSQFGKMLLGALGYQAEAEGLVGSGWEINVAKLVQTAKLNKSLNVAMSRTMTREQAAQMAFNTLNARLVEYQGGTKVTTPDGTVVNVGGVRNYITPVTLFMDNNFPNLKASNVSSDNFGRPATLWKNGGKTIGTFDDKPEFVYTAETEAKDVKADLGGYDIPVVSGTGVSVELNTQASGLLADVDTTAEIAGLTANGRAVEVYTSADEVTDVVVIDTYLATISSVSTANKTVRFKAIGGLTFDEVTFKNDEALYNDLANMGKDAKVLVNTDASGKILAVAEPETVVGGYTATNKDGDEITVGGSKYTLAVNSTPATATSLTLGTTYTLYLDPYGYVIMADEDEDTAATLGYVLDVKQEGSSRTGYILVARLVLADGTQKWVDVSSVDGDKVDDNTPTSDIDSPAPVAYSEKSDGTYSITNIHDNGSTIASITADPAKDVYYSLSSAAIEKNEVNFITGSNIQGNSKTLFLVKTGNTYKAYTGVKNVPNMTGVNGFVVIAEGTTAATLVVVTANSTATNSSSYAYITRSLGAERVDGTDLYLYEAVAKGAVVTLKAVGSSNNNLAAGLYAVDYDSDGYAAVLTPNPTADVLDGDSATVSKGVVTITDSGTPSSHMSADDFKAFVVLSSNDKAADIEASEVAAYTAASVIALLDDDGFVTTLIVIEA